MAGGGSHFFQNNKNKPLFTFGTTLPCDITSSRPQRLEVNWDTSSFHLESLTAVSCSSAGAPNPPAAAFNTLTGTGIGRYNGVSGGATATFTFVDNGEPGTSDTVTLTITPINGLPVLSYPTPVNFNGNLQALP